MLFSNKRNSYKQWDINKPVDICIKNSRVFFHPQYFFVFFHCRFAPKPKDVTLPSVALVFMGSRAGDRHIKGVESTSYLRRIELRKFNIHPHDKAMVNVHGLYIHKTDNPKYPFRYAYGVGFGIAYPRMEGIAKA